MPRIGFLGTGEIASSMVSTIASDEHRIFVSERNATFFVTTGLLLPLLDQFALTAQWLVGYTEDQGSAERYLAALLGGYCRMLNQSPELDLDTLRRGLSTQGGLNKTLSDSLSDQGAGKALEAGLDGLGARLGLTKRVRL